ncbi:MAG: glycosyltransferase [Candidatus Binatia bacterium]
MTSLRILFVTPYIPSPLRVRPYHLIRELTRRNHRVTVAALCTPEEEDAAVALRTECERVETLPLHRPRALWHCIRQRPWGIPLQALYTQSSAMERLIQAELYGVRGGAVEPCRYDLVHVEHLRAARFGLLACGLPRVYDAVDCISRLLEHTAALAASRLVRSVARIDLQRTRRLEARLIGEFDRTLVASDADGRALGELATQWRHGRDLRASPSHARGGPPITVLANGVDLQCFRPADTAREPATLVFVGRMSYHANITAILRFTREVMPLIWAQRPDTRLLLVGAAPARAVRRLARVHGSRVVVTGYVPDTRPFLARATVSVSPLVYAVGTQNKILQAMAMGTPVVATPPGCDALQVQPGRDLLVADDAAQFAHHVVRLFDDAALRRWLAENGRRYVDTHHDWHVAGTQLEAIYGETIARRCVRTDPAWRPMARRAGGGIS